MSLLLALAVLGSACGNGGAPATDTATPALLPSDSAAQVAVPRDTVDARGVPGVESDAPTGSGEAAAPPAAGAPAPAAAPAGSAGPAAAPDPAAAILRRASAAYEDVRSLRADFVMRRDVPLLKQTITSRGTLYQRSPDRIALRFTDPAGDVILSDGEFFWVYYPSTDPEQVMQWPAAQGGSSGVDLKAQFVGNPVERFAATLHGTETVGGSATNVLTLVPRQRAEYRSLKVWLDAGTSLARRFEITEHNGSMRRFDLDNVQTNITIPDATFRFSPPAGARIIKAN